VDHPLFTASASKLSADKFYDIQGLHEYDQDGDPWVAGVLLSLDVITHSEKFW